MAGTRPERRVAIVTSGLDLGGGIPTVARWLAQSLRKSGQYAVDIHDLATWWRDDSSRRIVAPRSWWRQSLAEERMEESGRVCHWGANAVEIEFMRYCPRRELKRSLQDYDVIQVVSGSAAWAFPAVFAGVPVALHFYSTAAAERPHQLASLRLSPRLWRRGMTLGTSWIEMAALRRVAAVLAPNAGVMDLAQRTCTVPVVRGVPGIDTERFQPRPGGWNRSGHLLCVCRLADARKGLPRLVQAYARMVDQSPAVPPLIIAGVGEAPAPLTSLIASLGLADRVQIMSHVPAEALPSLYREASVFILTSYEEGFGLSVVEAMACGVPVVSTATNGARETVTDGVTGILVREGSTEDVIEAVASAVLGALDGDGASLGAQGRQRCVETFSSSVAIGRFTGVYDALVA